MGEWYKFSNFSRKSDVEETLLPIRDHREDSNAENIETISFLKLPSE
jgi:hypothetical protein